MNTDKENKEVNSDQSRSGWHLDVKVSESFAIELARMAYGRNCSDVIVLDLNGRSPVARYFVIATGTSSQQVRSVADEMSLYGKQNGNRAYGNAGLQEGRWAVVDFVDVIVHIFDKEYRDFYNLEMLWGDAPRIDWQSGYEGGQSDGTGPGIEIH